MMQTRGLAAYILDDLLISPFTYISLILLLRYWLLYKPGTMHGRKDRHTRATLEGTLEPIRPDHDLQGVISKYPST